MTYDQALKMDRKDWRMWANFLVACVRSRNWSRALSVMRVLVDLYRDLGHGYDAGQGGDGVDIPALGVVTSEVLASVDEGRQQAVERVDTTTGHVESAVTTVPNADTAEASDTGDSFGPTLFAPIEGDDDVDAAPPTDEGPGVQSTVPASVSTPSTRTASAAHGEAHTDSAGNPARFYLEHLAQLYEHITSVISKDPRVWGLYARVQEARGIPDEALSCRLRQCRALQTAPAWDKTVPIVAALARASEGVVRGYQARNDSASLMAARMHVETILRRIEAGGVLGADADPVVALQSLLHGLPSID